MWPILLPSLLQVGDLAIPAGNGDTLQHRVHVVLQENTNSQWGIPMCIYVCIYKYIGPRAQDPGPGPGPGTGTGGPGTRGQWARDPGQWGPGPGIRASTYGTAYIRTYRTILRTYGISGWIRSGDAIESKLCIYIYIYTGCARLNVTTHK